MSFNMNDEIKKQIDTFLKNMIKDALNDQAFKEFIIKQTNCHEHGEDCSMSEECVKFVPHIISELERLIFSDGDKAVHNLLIKGCCVAYHEIVNEITGTTINEITGT